MAIPLRHLIWGLACLASSLSPLTAQSQPAPDSPPPPTFRLLSLGYVPDMLYDIKGKPQKVTASEDNYSPPYLCPPDGEILFYRLKPATTPKEPPVKVPVVQARIEKKEGKFIILLAADPHGPAPKYIPPTGNPDDPNYIPPPPTIDHLIAMTLEDSPEAHPVATVRVINLSRRPAALKIGSALFQIAPLQNQLVPYPGDKRVWMHVATLGDQGWQRVIGGPQSFAPGTRIVLFLNDIPPSKHDLNPIGLSMKKIIETVTPPTPPAPSLARR